MTLMMTMLELTQIRVRIEVHLLLVRFNVPEAVQALLGRVDVDVNAKSKLGSSPAMVAVKYASSEALKVSFVRKIHIKIIQK